jgi:hypothetical protein
MSIENRHNHFHIHKCQTYSQNVHTQEDGKKKKKEEKKNNVVNHVSFHERMAGQEWNSGKPCTN